jgi:hypothetical protein
VLDHGGVQLRRQASNLRLAINSRASYRLDYTGTKGGGSRTRTCGRGTVYALATRCLTELGHASSAKRSSAQRTWGRAWGTGRFHRLPEERFRAKGEGFEPPRPQGPPVFETGYRACGSPSSDPGRIRTCNSPIKSRQLCRVELRSRDEMWPATIEPATPRVSGGRSTGPELRPHEQMGEAGIEPATSCV